jgi:hypothetical protein
VSPGEEVSATGAPPRLAAVGLAREYGHVVALDGVSVEFKPGLADHLLVMRAGRVRATMNPKETTLRELAELMVGSA